MIFKRKKNQQDGIILTHVALAALAMLSHNPSPVSAVESREEEISDSTKNRGSITQTYRDVNNLYLCLLTENRQKLEEIAKKIEKTESYAQKDLQRLQELFTLGQMGTMIEIKKEFRLINAQKATIEEHQPLNFEEQFDYIFQKIKILQGMHYSDYFKDFTLQISEKSKFYVKQSNECIKENENLGSIQFHHDYRKKHTAHDIERELIRELSDVARYKKIHKSKPHLIDSRYWESMEKEAEKSGRLLKIKCKNIENELKDQSRQEIEEKFIQTCRLKAELRKDFGGSFAHEDVIELELKKINQFLKNESKKIEEESKLKTMKELEKASVEAYTQFAQLQEEFGESFAHAQLWKDKSDIFLRLVREMQRKNDEQKEKENKELQDELKASYGSLEWNSDESEDDHETANKVATSHPIIEAEIDPEIKAEMDWINSRMAPSKFAQLPSEEQAEVVERTLTFIEDNKDVEVLQPYIEKFQDFLGNM